MKTPKPKLGTLNEFSRFIKTSELPAGSSDFEISAKATERDLLAARMALTKLHALSATITVKPLPGGRYFDVKTQFNAAFEQECVVSALPVAGKLDVKTQDMFSKDQQTDDHQDDPPEPLENGGIDLGELIAQHMILNLPAFPRAPQAAIDLQAMKLAQDELLLVDDPEYDAKLALFNQISDDAPAPSPFKALEKLKSQKQSK
ncbi:MAG: DUF177 domain-containing protein [Alphaproteobacteria bacterium]